MKRIRFLKALMDQYKTPNQAALEAAINLFKTPLSVRHMDMRGSCGNESYYRLMRIDRSRYHRNHPIDHFHPDDVSSGQALSWLTEWWDMVHGKGGGYYSTAWNGQQAIDVYVTAERVGDYVVSSLRPSRVQDRPAIQPVLASGMPPFFDRPRKAVKQADQSSWEANSGQMILTPQ